MWRRILGQGLHADRAVLCTPISGACIRIGQICLLLPEVEILFLVLRLLFLPGATFPSSWFQVLVNRCICSGVRLIGFEGWLYMCVVVFRHIDGAVVSVDVVKS